MLRSAANIVSFLELVRFPGLIAKNYFVGPIPEYPVFKWLRTAEIHYPLEHLLKECFDCYGVVQAKLIQVDLLVVVRHHLRKVLHNFSRSFAASVVENNIDWLRADLLEVQLRPYLSLQLFESFLCIVVQYLIFVDEDVGCDLLE